MANVKYRQELVEFLFLPFIFMCVVACSTAPTNNESATKQHERDARKVDDESETSERHQKEDLIEPSFELPSPGDRPSRKELKRSLRKGVRFLLQNQNNNGSWGTPEQTKNLNIFAPPPGGHHAFQIGSTSLCLMALLELDRSSPEIEQAITDATGWLLDMLPRLRRATPTAIYNVWGHTYGIQALVRLIHNDVDSRFPRSRLRDEIRRQIRMLKRYEFVRGGWGYYDFRHHTKEPGGNPTSFTTGSVLIALKEAETFSIDVPEPMVKKALRLLRRQQKPDFSYVYNSSHLDYPMSSVNRPAGSLGRSQVCNAALRMWGDQRVTDRVLSAWLDRLFARNGWFDTARKRPVPHNTWFAVSGYFFFYGHFYATYCMRMLSETKQARYGAHMAKIMLDTQEKDGSWWDYPLYNYHKFYGTGFALATLQRSIEMLR